jgi:hypothetical protein
MSDAVIIGQGDEQLGDLDDGQAVKLERPARTGAARHLVPFVKGDERARAAGRKGGQARAARAAAQRAEPVAVLDAVRSLARQAERADLGPAAVGAALDMIGRVVSGDQRVPDPAAWLRALVDVARLEAGEATSATLVAHVGSDAAARVLALQARARSALSSTVLAADDVDPPAAVVEGEIVEHEHGAAAERGV